MVAYTHSTQLLRMEKKLQFRGTIPGMCRYNHIEGQVKHGFATKACIISDKMHVFSTHSGLALEGLICKKKKQLYSACLKFEFM